MLNLNTLRRLACPATLGAFLLAIPAFGQQCTCPGDQDLDGLIDGGDLGALLGQWGSADARGDINQDGNVDGADLGALLGAWGACTGPSNDYCFNALPIEDGVHFFCTTLATTDGPSFPGSSCQSGITHMVQDIWFRYTATATGTLTLSTCDEASFDTVIAVYGAAAPGVAVCPSAGQGILLGCNDDDLFYCAGTTSIVTVPVTVGYIYTIRVGGFSNGGGGHLTVVPGTLGSSCANPRPAPYGNFPVVISGATNDNVSTQDYPQTCLNGTNPGGREWVRWVAPCAGTVTATTCMPGTDFDTVLTVVEQQGAACWSNYITCNDDSSQPGCQIFGQNRKSRVEFAVQAYHTYFFVVSGYAGSQGNYELSIVPDCN